MRLTVPAPTPAITAIDFTAMVKGIRLRSRVLSVGGGIAREIAMTVNKYKENKRREGGK